MAEIKIVHEDIARLQRENDRLRRQLNEQNEEFQSALIELAELFAAQDDAIVELAALIEDGE